MPPVLPATFALALAFALPAAACPPAAFAAEAGPLPALAATATHLPALAATAQPFHPAPLGPAPRAGDPGRAGPVCLLALDEAGDLIEPAEPPAAITPANADLRARPGHPGAGSGPAGLHRALAGRDDRI
ncbi:MAG TPA: hypothetical protein VFR34_13145 [Paracoccaceae bacterium]|nr:hypothetical protein [Paracoccaceae bacterium]